MQVKSKNDARYIVGECDPQVSFDLGGVNGRGDFNSRPATQDMIDRKKKLTNFIFLTGVRLAVGKDTARHFKHYFSATGKDLQLDLVDILSSSTTAHARFVDEVSQAKAFVETLPVGTHNFASEYTQICRIPRQESYNWFFGLNSHQTWGRGSVTIAKGTLQKEYKMKFQYKIFDHYNWNRDGVTTILSLQIINILKKFLDKEDVYDLDRQLVLKDNYFREFHRQGLAKEFFMEGTLEKDFSWCEGENIPDTQYKVS